jgi:hypothetical protein
MASIHRVRRASASRSCRKAAARFGLILRTLFGKVKLLECRIKRHIKLQIVGGSGQIRLGVICLLIEDEWV